MNSKSLALSSYLALLLVGVSLGRPLSKPLNECEPYAEYSSTLSCYDLINTKAGSTPSNHHPLSQQDLERILESFSGRCPRQGHRFDGSPVKTSSSRIIDIEVPLSTTYLMSREPTETSEDAILLREPVQESSLTPTEISAVDAETQEAQYLLCLQKTSVVHSSGIYWDQDRSMDAVIGIVVLFLAIVLIAETAEAMVKLSVPCLPLNQVFFYL